LAILVAVAIVETCLAHAALNCSRNRQHPPAGTKLQLTLAQNQVRLLHCRAMTPQRWARAAFRMSQGLCSTK
jgi:hypothetical protein